MGRKILFITTDQQRYDALGCNGGTIARTPVVDALAAEGIVYRRAYNQNTVCMPARSTMLTGQYVRTHGVFANGVALPADAPSVAAHLADRAGYRTALVGKAHFEPGFDPTNSFEENARAVRGDTGPWRGFDHAGRVPWRELDRPPGHPGSDEAIRAVLAQKPAHWLAWYEGRWKNREGGPGNFCPGSLTHDQVREISAKCHVMNELVDEACGRVL